MYAQILATRTPLYEFIPLILSDVFPFDISYNSVGSTRFATDVVMVDSGDDQRIGRWENGVQSEVHAASMPGQEYRG